jgi:putative transposase
VGDPAGPQRHRHLTDRAESVRFLIHDRDTKFTVSFDEVFRSEGLRITRTPVRAAAGERLHGTVVRDLRPECLDRLLIVGRRHLEAVLREYASHYNVHRPHRSLDQRAPTSSAKMQDQTVVDLRAIRRRDRLGGLIHEYEVAA